MKRPALPALRRIKDSVVDLVVGEFRELFRQVLAETLLFGEIVTVTFAAADTATKVAHSLDRNATGYLVIRRTANITVRDASGEGLWVQADDVGSATIYVF